MPILLKIKMNNFRGWGKADLAEVMKFEQDAQAICSKSVTFAKSLISFRKMLLIPPD